jgi:SLT domain-containing protein
VVIGSYVNYAVVIGDDVSSVFPMYVQKYKLWDINAKAGTPCAGLVRKAMEEMDHFYRGGNVTG